MKIHSFWNPPSSDYDKIVGESLTVPDQSLSVRDILMRFTRGSLILPPVETGEDDDIENCDRFDDLVDANDAVASGQSIIDDFRSRTIVDSSPERENTQGAEIQNNSD